MRQTLYGEVEIVLRAVGNGVFAAWLLASWSAAQTTWFVDANAASPGQGTSQDPYQQISFALAQSGTQTGDTIFVRPGVYLGGVDFLGKGVELVSEGGSAVTTIASAPASSTVLVSSGEQGVVIEGFTIEAGEGTLAGINRLGGGLYCVQSSLTVRDCVVQGGAADEGGGVYLVVSDLALVNATIRNNFAVQFGGGLSARGLSSIVATNSLVESNEALVGGGVFASTGTSYDWSGCVFQFNEASAGGAYSGSVISTLTDCVLTQNSATPVGGFGRGGATVGSLSLLRCQITENVANGEGGGFNGGFISECVVRGNRIEQNNQLTLSRGAGGFGADVRDSRIFDNYFAGLAFGIGGGLSEGVATNCQIFNNRASQGGGVGGVDLNSCTLFGNQATEAQSGGVAVLPTQASIHNSIVWGNLPLDIADPGLISVSYSDVGNGWPGVGNISADPLFWFADGEDFHLMSSSPAIDAGDPSSPLDSDGSLHDMGALAFAADYCPGTETHCQALVDSAGCQPVINVSGQPSLSLGQNCVVSASGIQSGKNGLFFYGIQGRAELPFVGGLLCVQPPLRRTNIQNSGGSFGRVDCTGSFAFDLNAWLQSGSDPLVASGTQIDGQYWYRDTLAPAGSGLSNAMSGVVCP